MLTLTLEGSSGSDHETFPRPLWPLRSNRDSAPQLFGLRHKPVTSNQQTETVSHAVMLESASARHVKPIDSLHHSGCDADLISIYWQKTMDFALLAHKFTLGGRVTSSLEENRKIEHARQSPSFLFICLLIFLGICNHLHFSTHEAITSLKEIFYVW